MAIAPAQSDRFRTLVDRIASWTDAELAVVSPVQVRHVAQVVRDGADPTYPPSGGESAASPWSDCATRSMTDDRQIDIEDVIRRASS